MGENILNFLRHIQTYIPQLASLITDTNQEVLKLETSFL
jgi:hypothetical protein